MIELTSIFRALADETRQQIVLMLSEREMSAGEIASMFQIAQPSVSHHLCVLKNAKLISAKRQGQHIVYSLNTDRLEDGVTAFASRLHQRRASCS